MHLIKTQKGSQFYKFHSNSEVATACLTYNVPKINDKAVEILQIAYIDNPIHNIIVEFVYLKNLNEE